MADSKLEERLRKTEMEQSKPPPQQAKLKSALDSALDSVDDELAAELNRTKAEEIIARRRESIARISARLGDTSENNAVRTEKSESSMTEIATDLLNKGLPVEIVSRLVDGMLNRQAGMIYSPGMMGQPQQQGPSLADIIALAKELNNKPQTDPAITKILETLTEEVKSLKEKANQAPQLTGSIVVQQPDGSWVEVAKSTETKVIPRPSPQIVEKQGKSVDEIKEEHRHIEELARLNNEKQFKDSLATSIADAAGAVATFAGEKALTGADKGSAARTNPSPDTLLFTCEECKTKFNVPANAKFFKCPKCGLPYGDAETVKKYNEDLEKKAKEGQ